MVRDGTVVTRGTDAEGGTIVVARHGRTDWNENRRFQGWAAVGLNEHGRRQARALGEHLAETERFDRLLASDLRRTRETTALLREAGVDPEPEFSATWRERDLGIYQGLTYADVYGDHPEFDPSNGLLAVESRPKDGESLLDLHRRVKGGWEPLCETVAETGETVLLVTHGGPLHVICGLVHDQDLVAAFADHSHENCALSEFAVGADRDAVEVRCTNETAWELTASEETTTG